MPFVTVASLSKLPPGSLIQIEADGREYTLCNTGEAIYALDGTCPHAGGPLGEGALHGNMVVCPWHAWEFDCRTGQNDFDPATRVSTHSVRLEGDDIQIQTEPNA